MPENQKKTNRTLKWVLIIIIIIACCVLGFSAYKLFGISKTYKEAADYYSLVEDTVVSGEDTGSQPNTDSKEIDPAISADSEPVRYSSLVWNYAVLKDLCEDAVGYIFQEGTKISYPVLQAEDNQKYLRHMMNGEYNIAGSIFLDYHYPGGLDAPYSIIYGHNMDDGSMFGSLTNYKDEEYYRKHPTMELYAGEKCYMYYVFAALKTTIDSFIFDYVEDKEDLVALTEKAIEKTSYQTNAPEITGDSQVTVLTTCIDYPRDYTYRYAVFLVRGEELRNRKYMPQSNLTAIK